MQHLFIFVSLEDIALRIICALQCIQLLCALKCQKESLFIVQTYEKLIKKNPFRVFYMGIDLGNIYVISLMTICSVF